LAKVVSEHELARSRGVSRPTARAALQELERRYLVRRVRGSGTFVHRRIDYVIGPDTARSWSEGVRQAGSTPTSTVVRHRGGAASAAIRERLELPDSARVVTLLRINEVDGLPAGMGTSYLPADLLPDLAAHLGVGTVGASIYRTLVDHYGLEPVRTWTSASLEVPPPDVAARIGLETSEPTWSVESINRDRASGRPVELALGWMRADVYRIILRAGDASGGGNR
jgi:GntR family transcriptional regulator